MQISLRKKGHRMKRLLLLGAVLLGIGVWAAPAGAVTLVDDNGSPIGGPLQTYADRAQAPTLAGTLIVREATAACPVACSTGPGDKVVNSDGSLWVQTPAYGPAITWASPTVNEYQFDWELGHQFDWAYLTDADRQAFATLWHSPAAQWWNSDAVQSRGGEDGLERVFAADYASCAMGYTPSGTAEPANPQDVCNLIDAVGQRVGAHMPPVQPPAVVPVTVAPQQASHHPRRHHHRFTHRRPHHRPARAY
jgi:hypothetical protein